MKQNPLVSVLMTAYNREQYISLAIESVLSSTYTNFELIIVDDCSHDKTVEIAKKYEIKDSRVKVYVNEKNLGDYPNRNKAASFAKGKYLKYLDSDDIMYSYCLETMVNAMEKNPEAAFGLSSADEESPFPILISPPNIYKESLFTYKNHFSRGPGSSIIKREVFIEIGGFTEVRHIGDTEMWLKLAQKHYLVKFQFALYWNRLHQETESNIERRNPKVEKLRKKLVINFILSNKTPLTDIEKKQAIYILNKKNIFQKIFSKIKFVFEK